ncbi:MAG: hypothetical protein Q9186_005074 [Xanthomendoza sp. 1 TL-2023]
MASTSTNQFPTFHDGDVEIRLSRIPGDRLVLHSFILGLHSSFLKASLDQRWSGNDNTVKGVIKWQYELTFDSDGLGLLCRKNSTVTKATTNGNDEKFFYQDKALPETRSNENLEATMAVIEAHRRYLKANYYIPFDISFTSFDNGFAGLKQLSDLTKVGDLYDGLKTLKTLVDCLVLRHIDTLRSLLVARAPTFLYIASKLEIDWLFKDIVCQTIGDTSRDDDQVKNDFTPSQATLILKNRRLLRSRMDRIDLQLLMIDIPPGNTSGYKVAVHELREQILKSVHSRKEGLWKDHKYPYNELPQSLSSSTAGYGSGFIFSRSSGPASAGDSNEMEVINSMHKKVCNKVEEILVPLYQSFVSPVCKRTTGRRGNPFEVFPIVPNFTCIGVLDQDLPWIKG